MKNRFVLLFVMALATFGLSGCFGVDPGEKAMIDHYSDGLDSTEFAMGTHGIAPWNSVVKYSIIQQTVEDEMEVLSKDGLSVVIKASIYYRPVEGKLYHLHLDLGENYHARVQEEFRGGTKSVVGRYTPEELYSTKRDAIENEISAVVAQQMKQHHVIIEKVIVKDVDLPEAIKTAIETKLQKEQESLQMEYEIDLAMKTAKRDSVEAAGKAQANKILNQSLTPNILKEKGIQATEKLANSPNTKVIIVGDKDGMPLIMGNQ